ncbi:MAG: hypothetical protein EOM68_00875 [Spirochaetia bacterium]|nr:hypothetical protein [Spirochaetia bacterium]
MKKGKVVVLSVCIVLFFSSCASLAKKERPYYHFQGMAQSGVLVATVDAIAEPELVASAFGSLTEFAKRARRVSLSLTPTNDTYPLDQPSLAAYGVVEGDYPRFLLNTGMMYARELSQKGNADGLSWFSQKDGPLSLYTPKNDELVFTNGSYESAYASYKARQRLITDEMALQMADASIALYAYEPQTFFDLGLNLPQSVFQQAREVLLLVHQGQGTYTIDAFIQMETPKLANTLSQMVRSGYLARLKKDKIPFKIADLKLMFLLDEELVSIVEMPLSEEQMQMLKQSLTGAL